MPNRNYSMVYQSVLAIYECMMYGIDGEGHRVGCMEAKATPLGVSEGDDGNQCCSEHLLIVLFSPKILAQLKWHGKIKVNLFFDVFSLPENESGIRISKKKSRSGGIKFAVFDCPQLYRYYPCGHSQKMPLPSLQTMVEIC